MQLTCTQSVCHIAFHPCPADAAGPGGCEAPVGRQDAKSESSAGGVGGERARLLLRAASALQPQVLNSACLQNLTSSSSLWVKTSCMCQGIGAGAVARLEHMRYRRSARYRCQAARLRPSGGRAACTHCDSPARRALGPHRFPGPAAPWCEKRQEQQWRPSAHFNGWVLLIFDQRRVLAEWVIGRSSCCFTLPAQPHAAAHRRREARHAGPEIYTVTCISVASSPESQSTGRPTTRVATPAPDDIRS